MPMLSELHFMLRTSHTMENRNPTPNGKSQENQIPDTYYIFHTN
jgi:hypothetical protein